MVTLGSRTSHERGRLVAVVSALAVAVLVVGTSQWAAADGPMLTPAQRALADERPIRVGWPEREAAAAHMIIFEGDRPVAGWGYDLWTLMAIQSGVEVTHVVFDSLDETIGALRDGTVDVLGAMGPRPGLRAFATPAEPLVWDRLVLVGRPLDLEEETELAVRRVTTGAGSVGEAILARQFPEATLVPARSPAEALDLLDRRDVDLWLTLLSLAGLEIRDRDLRVLPVEVDEATIEASPWTTVGSPYTDLVDAARSTLTDAQIAESTLRATGFDLSAPRSGQRTWPRLFVIGFAGALAALIAATALVWILRRRVRNATTALREANLNLEERVALRTAEVELTNASLTRFARSVAHDLRNPITVISGMTHLLRHENLDEETQVRILEAVERSSLKLSDMIAAMLDDALAAGAQAPVLDGRAFEAWLRGAMAAEILQCGARFEVVAPVGHLDLDVALLLKVSVNLVGNALKYAVNPDGVHIRIALSRSDDRWIITVDDNGPGVGSEVLEAVFSRGYRGHQDDRGQGWGLADLRELLQQGGGSISAGMSPLGGAHFVVVLPQVELASVSSVEAVAQGIAPAGFD